MKLSLKLIDFDRQKYGWCTDLTAAGTDSLLAKIGAQLGAIEEVTDIGKRYHGTIIVKVIECSRLPDSDHLNICKIDDAGAVKDAARDDKGLVQVVCGAPNVRAGLTVVWLPPGSTVPATVGSNDPFVLGARELRGVLSYGMLASPKELALNDSHEGILELDDTYDAGQDFAEALNLKDDLVIDIENKMFTHRPDCFGYMGVARELAGIQGLQFKSPDWYSLQPDFAEPMANLPLIVHNELPELVPRFAVIVISDVKVGPSPSWLKIELAKLGQKSINNIVDYTNFFMLQTGQPLHAYDYDKLKALSGKAGATIIARKPKPNEKLKLLNGKEIEPRSEAIIIATDQQAIGLGGVMGGSETEVDLKTKNIVLEAASFDMYSIRRTSMAHGLFTEAVTRFSKGQSPLQNAAVLSRIVTEIQQHAGGKLAGRLIDHNHLPTETLERGSLHPPVKLELEFINSRLGLNLVAGQVQSLLQNVEFKVEIDESAITVTAPFWRTDIELREDVVEEVGRLYGFDELPLELPKRDITPVKREQLLEFKQKLRQILSRAGANEVLTYSFVHGDLLKKTGQDVDKAFQISNALSPDLQYYRLSLTPSLLEKVHPNVKAGYYNFALFEIGKGHNCERFDDNQPKEIEKTALVVTSAGKTYGAQYYQAKQLLEYLASNLGLRFNYQSVPPTSVYQTAKPFDLSRSAHIVDATSGTIVGIIGEYKLSVSRSLKLPQQSAGFELSTLKLMSLSKASRSYRPLPRFPVVSQDISLKVADEINYQQLYDLLSEQIAQHAEPETLWTLSPLDIYRREDDPAHKQTTLRLQIASYKRTLNDKEVNQLLDKVAASVHDKFGAERI